MNAHNEQQCFTAADIADQGARQFAAGYAAVKAELHAAAQEAVAEVSEDSTGWRYINWSAEWFSDRGELPPVGTKLYAAPVTAAPGTDLTELRAIANDLSHSAKVDGYEPQQIAFIESIRDRLLALIDASPKGDEAWQPIETAAKDARWLMLGIAGRNEIMIGYWHNLFKAWWGQTGAYGDFKLWQRATHWMPMPNAPKQSGDAGVQP